MTSTHFKAKREIYISSLIISRLHSINLSYTEDFAECSFHHCLVSSTSPAAFRSRPCTELDNLEIKGATSHSGPFTTTDFWLLWAVASGVVSCRWTKTLMALVATASSRGPVSYDKIKSIELFFLAQTIRERKEELWDTSLETCLIISCNSNQDFLKDHWSKFCKQVEKKKTEANGSVH